MDDYFQPAKQARSHATQVRILQATANLLRRESFDAITIRRIVQEAESSIGSFYARFRDKEALLPALYADYENELGERVQMLENAIVEGETLDHVANLIAQHFVETYGSNPNLSRALFEYSTRPSETDESKRHSAKRLQQYSFLVDALGRFKDEVTHPNPRRGAELGLYFLTVSCRNRLFYPQHPQTRTLKIKKTELRVELARLLTGYLRA